MHYQKCYSKNIGFHSFQTKNARFSAISLTHSIFHLYRICNSASPLCLPLHAVVAPRLCCSASPLLSLHYCPTSSLQLRIATPLCGAGQEIQPASITQGGPSAGQAYAGWVDPLCHPYAQLCFPHRGLLESSILWELLHSLGAPPVAEYQSVDSHNQLVVFLDRFPDSLKRCFAHLLLHNSSKNIILQG